MAITTLYEGIEYRSRLEARWAAFFRLIGWHTTYEPFDGDGYIPDFLIHGNRPLLVEVKPAVTLADYQAPVQKAVNALISSWGGDILIVGADPFPRLVNSWGFNQMPPAGLLGDGMWQDGGWDFGVGNWMTCGYCMATGVFHDTGCYAGRPCGHYDGDHYLRNADKSHLRDAWAAACNDVKWKGRSVAPTQVVGLDVTSPTALPPKRFM